MIEDLEDFKAYLKGNCRYDYDRITRSDITEDTINAIRTRHDSPYQIWQYISIRAPWIISFYNGVLPRELLSGHIALQDFCELADKLAFQNLIYQNNEIVALRMQFTENLPNMVYSINTEKGLMRYEEELTKAGYNKENTARAVSRRKECYIFAGKAESLGISEEKITPFIKQAETVNIIEQFAILTQQLEQAQTPEERKAAQQQLKIFISRHADFLYNNINEVEKINTILADIKDGDNPPPPGNGNGNGGDGDNPPPPGDGNGNGGDGNNPPPPGNGNGNGGDGNNPPPPGDGNGNGGGKSFSFDSNSDIILKHDNFSSAAGPTPPTPKFSLPEKQEDTGIYGFLNNQIDTCVEKQLKILDNAHTVKKTLAPDTAEQKSFALTPKSLSEEIHLPNDLTDWNAEYLRKCAQTNQEWQQRMQQLSDRIITARCDTQSVDDFSAALYKSIGMEIPKHQSAKHLAPVLHRCKSY